MISQDLVAPVRRLLRIDTPLTEVGNCKCILTPKVPTLITEKQGGGLSLNLIVKDVKQ